MTAALLESLYSNHPFVDGNKRVAFFGADIFLRMNDYKFSIDAESAYEFLMHQFGTEPREFSDLVTWIKNNVVQLS